MLIASMLRVKIDKPVKENLDDEVECGFVEDLAA